MKRLILAAVMECLGFGPALAANNYVFVQYNGERYRIAKLDLQMDSVCAFKQQMANKFDLKMRKFDLKRNGNLLDEKKTLKGAYVNNSTTLSILEKSHSNQCT